MSATKPEMSRAARMGIAGLGVGAGLLGLTSLLLARRSRFPRIRKRVRDLMGLLPDRTKAAIKLGLDLWLDVDDTAAWAGRLIDDASGAWHAAVDEVARGVGFYVAKPGECKLCCGVGSIRGETCFACEGTGRDREKPARTTPPSSAPPAPPAPPAPAAPPEAADPPEAAPPADAHAGV